MQYRSVLALDMGQARIGIAKADTQTKLAFPLTTLTNDDSFDTQLQSIIDHERVGILVVGLPRGLEGQETAQTKQARQFAKKVEKFGLPVHLQDEAATSLKAEATLKVSKKGYEKGAIDALSAAYF